jgi:hypothetical protein
MCNTRNLKVVQLASSTVPCPAFLTSGHSPHIMIRSITTASGYWFSTPLPVTDDIAASHHPGLIGTTSCETKFSSIITPAHHYARTGPDSGGTSLYIVVRNVSLPVMNVYCKTIFIFVICVGRVIISTLYGISIFILRGYICVAVVPLA